MERLDEDFSDLGNFKKFVKYTPYIKLMVKAVEFRFSPFDEAYVVVSSLHKAVSYNTIVWDKRVEQINQGE